MNGTEPRIIKKYPNRRLYDTEISSYITLEDVRRLVIDQISIKVIDARSQNDITHSTLLQIIIEQEETGPQLFSIESLQQMIRSYGGTMQQILSRMLEQGMAFFTQEGAEKDPLRMMTDFAQKNMIHWQQLQQEWLQNFMAHKNKTKEPVVEAVGASEMDPDSLSSKE